MKKLHIYLFRHGQTTFNRDKRFTGWKNPPLTELGRENAETIAGYLKNKKFEVAVTSGLNRANDTLDTVLEHHPECSVTIEDRRVTERSYGSLAGKTHEAVIKKYGQKKYDMWHRGYRVRPPEGESFTDVEKRVKPFIKELIATMKRDKFSVAISAHGNSIRVFRKIMEKMSEAESSSWSIPFDKVFTYTVEA